MYKEVNGRWGKCKFLAKDEYVGRSMYYYGEYNPDETEMILSLATGLCLDIGANIGVISQALLANGHNVVAFEPQPELYELLSENMAASAIRDLQSKAVNSAVGDEVGLAPMAKVYYGDKGNFGGMGLFEKSIYGTINVPVVTIDGYNFDDVGFMKIDVEGYEYETLVGATETIKRCRPIMYIEDDRSAKSERLRKYIESLGYTIEEHRPTLYRENNFFGLKKNVWKANYASHNLICRPC